MYSHAASQRLALKGAAGAAKHAFVHRTGFDDLVARNVASIQQRIAAASEADLSGGLYLIHAPRSPSAHGQGLRGRTIAPPASSVTSLPTAGRFGEAGLALIVSRSSPFDRNELGATVPFHREADTFISAFFDGSTHQPAWLLFLILRTTRSGQLEALQEGRCRNRRCSILPST
ncbi:hypothetical protein CF328_g3815 [Tilletia controversa]|nr:hypothetical protein CF328_g3815 [Tilletia controversa]